LSKRALGAVGAIAALVAGVSTAQATVSKGTFEGLVGAKANGDAFGFKVDKGGRVYSVHFTGITLSCTDSDKFDTPLVRTAKSDRFKVDSERKWGFTVDNKDVGNGHVVDGRFKSTGESSKGTLRVTASFDEVNNPDPDGSVKCDSGLLRWSATRQK
jgi:hypothetical protein